MNKTLLVVKCAAYCNRRVSYERMRAAYAASPRPPVGRVSLRSRIGDKPPVGRVSIQSRIGDRHPTGGCFAAIQFE